MVIPTEQMHNLEEENDSYFLEDDLGFLVNGDIDQFKTTDDVDMSSFEEHMNILENMRKSVNMMKFNDMLNQHEDN